LQSFNHKNNIGWGGEERRGEASLDKAMQVYTVHFSILNHWKLSTKTDLFNYYFTVKKKKKAIEFDCMWPCIL